MKTTDILRAMAKAYDGKTRPREPIAVSFDIDDGAEVSHLVLRPGEAARIESGNCADSAFTIVTTTEILRKMAEGRLSPLTAMARETLHQPAPLDVRLPAGVSLSPELYHRIVRFAQRFFNPLPGERIRIEESASRVVHGGHVVALFADVGFRSAWYLLRPGDRLNGPGDTNPFPQAFVIVSGSGTAQIGDVAHRLQANEAYYVPPGTQHTVRPSPDEELTLVWMAWGEGA
jgi:mannose-6-phosphate isomerase-like protein (cupin superfamily)